MVPYIRTSCASGTALRPSGLASVAQGVLQEPAGQALVVAREAPSSASVPCSYCSSDKELALLRALKWAPELRLAPVQLFRERIVRQNLLRTAVAGQFNNLEMSFD